MRAVVLIDADTKEILFAKNPDKWMHPASTTKMVTLLTALELKGTQLDELATISSYATSMEESILVYVLVIKSLWKVFLKV